MLPNGVSYEALAIGFCVGFILVMGGVLLGLWLASLIGQDGYDSSELEQPYRELGKTAQEQLLINDSTHIPRGTP